MANAQKKQYAAGRLGAVQKLLTEYIDPFSQVPIGKQLGFTDRYFDSMYAIGVKYYDNNRLDDAIKIAYQLVLLEPGAHRNYKLMGACLQAKEDYAAALNVYQKSIPLAILDAETYFYVGQCQFFTKAFADAVNSLKFAKHLCTKYPEQWSHIQQVVDELLTRAQTRATQSN